MSSDDWLSISSSSPTKNDETGMTIYNSTNYNSTIYNKTNDTFLYSNTTLIIDTTATSPVSAQFLSWCCFVLFCFLVRPNIPDASHRIAERARIREERLTELRKNPQVRERAMEQGLITKRVISCDAQSNLILGDMDGSINGDDMQSVHSTDPNASTCSICLEAFRFTDRVTWSRSSICRHVFHTDCLMEWLANPNHDDCPTCRAQIINVEQDHEIPPLDTRNSGMFMVMDGLISVVARRRSSLKEDINNAVLTEKRFPFSSGLQIAFQRVSSGIYSHLSQTFDLEDDDNTDEWKRPVKLRRTLSEGGPQGPFRTSCRASSTGSIYVPLSVRSRSTWEEEVEEENINDIESQNDPLTITPALRRTLSDGPSPTRQSVQILVSRPGLFATRCFRRSSSRNYSKLNKAVEEDYDDEDDLQFGDSWRDDEDKSRIPQQHPTVLNCEDCILA